MGWNLGPKASPQVRAATRPMYRGRPGFPLQGAGGPQHEPFVSLRGVFTLNLSAILGKWGATPPGRQAGTLSES
jgi:hypothetical protein